MANHQGRVRSTSDNSHVTQETLPKLLARNARELTNRPAIRAKEYGIWRVWTWRRVHVETRGIAAGLAALGVECGAPVVIVGDNRPQLYWSICAAQVLGAVPVLVFQEANLAEMGFVIEHAGADFAIAENQEQVDKLLAIRVRYGRPRHIVVKDERGLSEAAESGLLSFGAMLCGGEAWLAAHSNALDVAIDQGKGDDLAVLLYTPGTTGPPKGVMLSHDNVIAAARKAILRDGLCATDEVLAYLPMAWIGDYLCSYVQPLVAGFCVSCPENGATLLADLREIGPTFFIAPPRIFEALLRDVTSRMTGASQPKRQLYDRCITLARRVGGALMDGKPVSASERLRYRLADVLIYGPLRNALGFGRIRCAYVVDDAIVPEVFHFYRAIGLNLKQSYTLTEAGGFVCLQPDGKVLAETVGVAAPGVELRIDPAGEVLVRGEGTFIGYHKDTAATAVAMSADGWLRTGDIAVLDTEGQLRIVDRAVDMGRLRDGTVFAPRSIEKKLKFFAFIKEAVAIGGGRDCIACLLDIDADAVGSWADQARLGFASHQELTARPEVLDLLAGCVEAVNRDLAADPDLTGQVIGRFLILPKPLDADDGELTRMGKIRRAVIAERYAALIEGLYSGHERARINMRIGFDEGRESLLDVNVPIRVLGASAIAR